MGGRISKASVTARMRILSDLDRHSAKIPVDGSGLSGNTVRFLQGT